MHIAILESSKSPYMWYQLEENPLPSWILWICGPTCNCNNKHVHQSNNDEGLPIALYYWIDWEKKVNKNGSIWHWRPKQLSICISGGHFCSSTSERSMTLVKALPDARIPARVSLCYPSGSSNNNPNSQIISNRLLARIRWNCLPEYFFPIACRYRLV